MVSPLLLADLRRDEGLRLKAYPDPLSPLAKELAKPLARRLPGWQAFSGAPWTVAYGHTGSLAAIGRPNENVGPDTIVTQDEAEQLLAADAAEAEAMCARYLSFWARLDQVRRDVMANMMFNMGWDDPKTPRHEGLSEFVNTLACIGAGDYAGAAVRMKQSLWYRQVGDRAERLCRMMATGSRDPAAAPAGPVLPPTPTAVPITPAPAPVGWMGVITNLFNRFRPRIA